MKTYRVRLRRSESQFRTLYYGPNDAEATRHIAACMLTVNLFGLTCDVEYIVMEPNKVISTSVTKFQNGCLQK